MNGSNINELLTEHGYPPFDSDTMFAEMRYVSGTFSGGERKGPKP